MRERLTQLSLTSQCLIKRGKNISLFPMVAVTPIFADITLPVEVSLVTKRQIIVKSIVSNASPMTSARKIIILP
jgi:hypothetical protein